MQEKRSVHRSILKLFGIAMDNDHRLLAIGFKPRGHAVKDWNSLFFQTTGFIGEKQICESITT